MTEQQKQWIDSSSYEQLLRRWRESPIGSDWFHGDTGEYYSKVMAEKREKVGNDEHVRVSKSIGW